MNTLFSFEAQGSSAMSFRCYWPPAAKLAVTGRMIRLRFEASPPPPPHLHHRLSLQTLVCMASCSCGAVGCSPVSTSIRAWAVHVVPSSSCAGRPWLTTTPRSTQIAAQRLAMSWCPLRFRLCSYLRWWPDHDQLPRWWEQCGPKLLRHSGLPSSCQWPPPPPRQP